MFHSQVHILSRGLIMPVTPFPFIVSRSDDKLLAHKIKHLCEAESLFKTWTTHLICTLSTNLAKGKIFFCLMFHVPLLSILRWMLFLHAGVCACVKEGCVSRRQNLCVYVACVILFKGYIMSLLLLQKKRWGLYLTAARDCHLWGLTSLLDGDPASRQDTITVTARHWVCCLYLVYNYLNNSSVIRG